MVSQTDEQLRAQGLFTKEVGRATRTAESMLLTSSHDSRKFNLLLPNESTLKACQDLLHRFMEAIHFKAASVSRPSFVGL